MKLLFTLAYHQENAPQTEALLDFLYKLSNKQKRGHLILAHDAGVHAENRERIKISAELAFQSVYPLEIRQLADGNASKTQRINNAFRQVAEAVETGYSWPFLWLEPDCTPTCQDWMARLWQEYSSNPREYLGNRMQIQAKDKPGPMFMARTGIYPPDFSSKIVKSSEIKMPFEIPAGNTVLPKLHLTKLIQQLPIKSADDITKVRAEAVLVHGDKNQILLNKWEPPKVIPVETGYFQEAATEVIFGTPKATLTTENSALLTAPMNPQSIANEIDKSLNPPRQTRRQKAEALDKQHRLDCVATNGCKSSTPVQAV